MNWRRIVAGLLATVWLAIGGAKLLAPQLTINWLVHGSSLTRSVGGAIAYVIIALELGLALWGFSVAIWQWRPKAYGLTSATLGIIAAIAALALPSSVPCGCFGDLGKATPFHKLAVAGIVQWLSWEVAPLLGSGLEQE